MPDIFGISISGLLSNQSALNTTSHNIANANTEGYSRQRTSFTQRNPEFIGGSYFGSGLEVDRVSRIFEQTHQLEIQSATATFMSLETYLSQANRVDGLLADSDNGINQAIQLFFSAVDGVSNDPASIAARQVLLDSANGLTARFASIHSQLENQTTQINVDIQSVAQEITSLGESIAAINNQIVSSPGDYPPDLLDKRDLAITQLSELVAVQTSQAEDGSVTVFVGSGQSLVIGSLSNRLVASVDTQNPKEMSLSFESGSSSVEVTDNITGGKIGGLLAVVDEVIDPAFNTLGRVALAMANSINNLSQLGIDINSQLGNNFFTDINDSTIELSRVSADINNAGTASISLSIDDPSLLDNSSYTLRLQAGNYLLVDQSTDSTVASFAAPAVVPASVSVASAGITINFLSGAGVDGDSFDVQPTRNFARDIKALLTDPGQIAAASPIRGEQSASNIGDGVISGLSVTDTTTVQFTGVAGDLNPPIRIEFDAPPGTPGEFSIYDMSSGSPVLISGGISGYVANQDNNLLALAGVPFNAYGYEVTLNGDPQPGDSFDISYNTNGAGSNDNTVLLGALQQASTLDNGASTFQQAFGRIISQVGVNTQSAQIRRDASESILFQTKERRESLSGVNLDEEAANLIKFQQAYEASAQIINVARTLFQTVLDSVR